MAGLCRPSRPELRRWPGSTQSRAGPGFDPLGPVSWLAYRRGQRVFECPRPPPAPGYALGPPGAPAAGSELASLGAPCPTRFTTRPTSSSSWNELVDGLTTAFRRTSLLEAE